MASGGDNVGSLVDKEPPSTSFGEVLLCSDTIGVITRVATRGLGRVEGQPELNPILKYTNLKYGLTQLSTRNM